MSFIKKIIILIFAFLLAISCKGNDKSKTSSREIKVAYVINGALGDQAFYDSGQEGMDRISKDFGVKIATFENNFDTLKYPESMEALVKWGANVVFIIPYDYEDLLIEYIVKYPDIKFICIEPVVEAKNLLSVDFKENEGAFLAGVAAAIITTNTAIDNINPNKVIGLVAGDDSPVVMEFVEGYENGAKYIDKRMEVKTKFIGDWSDTTKGRQAANELYAQDVDIIFQVAALTGMGVLEAAKDSKKYAIGVDINQNPIQAGAVPASMIKDVGETIYLLFDKYMKNEIEKDGIIELGVKDRIIYLELDEYSKSILPEASILFIEDVAKKISNGEIVVPK